MKKLNEKSEKLNRYKHYLKNSEEWSDVQWNNRLIVQKLKSEMREELLKILDNL